LVRTTDCKMQFFPCFSNHFYHVNPVDKIKESSHFETCSSPGGIWGTKEAKENYVQLTSGGVVTKGASLAPVQQILPVPPKPEPKKEVTVNDLVTLFLEPEYTNSVLYHKG